MNLLTALVNGVVLLVPKALSLLAWALLLPLVFGVIGRAFIFERDEDDIGLRKNRELARALQRTEATAGELQPEPEPVYHEPWPEFVPSTVQPAPSSPAAAVTERPVPQERLVYRAVPVDDVETVKAEVQKAWRRFVGRSIQRPEWTRFAQLGEAPFALSGAAGDAPGSSTVVVETLPIAGADPRELMGIFEAEILPELRSRFGANSFRTGNRG